MRILLCDESLLYPRLNEKGVRWQYWNLFKELVIIMKSDNAQVSDNILEEIWSYVERSVRYNVLNHLENKGIISLFKDPKDKRNRHVSILIEYSDTFYEVWKL